MSSSSVDLSFNSSGSGDPLVLIMGLNAPGAAWQPHIDQWARRFECLAVDNRGAGSSPAPPGPYSTLEMADDYAKLIMKLGLVGCRVVGISMGGAIAQELALRHPELVSRLALVATWSRPDPYLASVLDAISLVRGAGDSAEFTALLQTLIWTPVWFRQHHQDLLEAQKEPLAVGPDALAAQVAACRSHDAFARLGQIRVPTLVTAGAVDRFVPIELSREIAETIPSADFEVFAATGHVHHWEELARFNNLVEEWMK